MRASLLLVVGLTLSSATQARTLEELGETIDLLALALVAGSGLYFLGLGIASLLRPHAARSFLLAFAATPTKHFVELGLRLIVGAAFVTAAERLPWPVVFQGVGWVLVVSTLLLALVPWRLHRRFAQTTVPGALRFLPLIGGISVLTGLAVLATVLTATAVST